ncbi:MAG: formylmethanofuran dehydrogenase subunit C [Candidatus Bathyarchaeota archaeon]|nr:MAG: formylmethanofuran dehydrogenase subunit C [Candidatus Bathyarchaeota archaeon]
MPTISNQTAKPIVCRSLPKIDRQSISYCINQLASTVQHANRKCRMPVKLTLKQSTKVPINGKCISPDVFSEKSLNEIAQLEMWEGNRKVALSELFRLEGESGKTPAETKIHLVGNLSRMRNIGVQMTAGEIRIDGSVGMHLGEKMKGGTISAKEDAGSWLGSQMKGGTIEVMKDAGNFVGAAPRGSTRGMRGGSIIIHGNAGSEVGSNMRDGLIQVTGNVDQFLGIRMQNGTIVVHGETASRPGAFMTGGKIVLLGPVESILPSFSINRVKK